MAIEQKDTAPILQVDEKSLRNARSDNLNSKGRVRSKGKSSKAKSMFSITRKEKSIVKKDEDNGDMSSELSEEK